MQSSRTLVAACVLALLLSDRAAAVTLLFGLEPGKSTRADAERVFGAPRRTGVFEVEYAPWSYIWSRRSLAMSCCGH
jgi:hypothetical protein